MGNDKVILRITVVLCLFLRYFFHYYCHTYQYIGTAVKIDIKKKNTIIKLFSNTFIVQSTGKIERNGEFLDKTSNNVKNKIVSNEVFLK